MRSHLLLAVCLLAVCVVAVACSREARPTTPALRVTRDSLSGVAERAVFLNEEIRVFFTDSLDPLSVTPDTVRVRDLDSQQLVLGRLSVGTRSLSFVPRPPLAAELDDGTLRLERRYRLEVVGFPSTNGVRAQSGRLLERSFTREFRTVSASQEPSPLLPFGVGDPRFARFQMAQLETLAIAVGQGTLRLHFNVPPLPSTVTPAAFRLIRPRDGGVVDVPLASARVVQMSDAEIAVGALSEIAPVPGTTIELALGERLEPGQCQFLWLKLEHGETALKDYGGRVVQDLEQPLTKSLIEFKQIAVHAGSKLSLVQQDFGGPTGERRDLPASRDGVIGFEAGQGVARPLARKEAGSGVLGAFAPKVDVVLAPGVPFDRGDGTLVRSDDGEFCFTSVAIPAGVTVLVRSDRPVRVRARGSLRIAGTLLLDHTPVGERLTTLHALPGSAAELIAMSGVCLIAGADAVIEGQIKRDGESIASPVTLMAAGRIRLPGRVPARAVLAAEIQPIDGEVDSAFATRVQMEEGCPPGTQLVAEAWTPWRRVAGSRSSATEIRLLGPRGKVQVSIQVAPSDPHEPDLPVRDPALLPEPIPLPLRAPLEWLPGSHVRFLLRAEVTPAEPMPSLTGIVILGG